MPIQGLRDCDSKVDESVCGNESVSDGFGLRGVVEKNEKAIQDERLADGERQEGESWEDDGNQRPSQRDDAASDEAMLRC
jgi:hypothetical protein